MIFKINNSYVWKSTCQIHRSDRLIDSRLRQKLECALKGITFTLRLMTDLFQDRCLQDRCRDHNMT